MRVRIVVKPSKVLYSDVWSYQVEEFFNGKWHLALIRDEEQNNIFFSGAVEGKDHAILSAKETASKYIWMRETYDHAIYQEIPRPAPYIEEIKVEQA